MVRKNNTVVVNPKRLRKFFKQNNSIYKNIKKLYYNEFIDKYHKGNACSVSSLFLALTN